MRLLLALALAVHLSGIPAAVASPCAEGAGAPGECCIRHQTESGGDVIGHCGCQAAAGDPGDRVAVSVAPTSPDRTDAPALTALPPSIPSTAALPAAWVDSAPVPTNSSPPRLSGTGFRC
jgi:hypothetical protein